MLLEAVALNPLMNAKVRKVPVVLSPPGRLKVLTTGLAESKVTLPSLSI